LQYTILNTEKMKDTLIAFLNFVDYHTYSVEQQRYWDDDQHGVKYEPVSTEELAIAFEKKLTNLGKSVEI